MKDSLEKLEAQIEAEGHEVLVQYDAGVWFALVDGERAAADKSRARLEVEFRKWWEGRTHG